MAVFGGWRITRTGIVFIAGILILVGLVTGGVFLVKNHGEAVRRDEAVKIAQQNLEDESQVAVQPVNSDEEVNSGEYNSEGTTDGADTTVAADSDAAQLPETGFDTNDGLTRVVIVSILALSVAMYVSSRRPAHTL